MTRFEREVVFEETDDPLHPYQAWVDGEHWQIRVSNLPDGTRTFSLLVDGRREEDFTEWPEDWDIPVDDKFIIETHEAELEAERRRNEAAERVTPIDLDDDEQDDDEEDDD